LNSELGRVLGYSAFSLKTEENFITGKLIFFKYSTSKLFYNDPG